jgi:hypothetical protein
MPNPEPPTPARPPAPRETGAADEDSPHAPAIPSFASLRAPRGRSAVDLLLPGAASGPAAAPAHAPRPAQTPRPVPEPRPAEYADLLRFGVDLVRAAVAVPGRLVGWAVHEPRACLRRVLRSQVR